MDRHDNLIQRVIESVPVGHPAFSKLLGLLKIRCTTEVPTACVSLGNRSELRINPEFVQKNCPTRGALRMLVLHELYHVLMGHTRMFKRSTPIDNLAFDALINAQLTLEFPEPENTIFFRNLYAEDELPEALLRPPEGFGTNNPAWKLTGRAGEVHRALYTDTSVTTRELYELLRKFIPAGSGVPLIGNHEMEEAKTLDPALKEELDRIIARWPMVERIRGRDQGGETREETIPLIRRSRRVVSIIHRALRPLLLCDDGGGAAMALLPGHRETVLPYRTRFDRRAEVLSTAGHEPFFFQGTSFGPVLQSRQKTHVYLDVSGSMHWDIPMIYSALASMMDHLYPRVHLFSTEVKDISFAALRRGTAFSTGGTDIACVSDHLLKNRISRTLVITDGWVGAIPSEHARKILRRRVRLHAVLTHDGDKQFLESIRGKSYLLPPRSELEKLQRRKSA